MFISYEALRGYFETETLSGQGGAVGALAFWQLAILLMIAGLGPRRRRLGPDDAQVPARLSP